MKKYMTIVFSTLTLGTIIGYFTGESIGINQQPILQELQLSDILPHNYVVALIIFVTGLFSLGMLSSFIIFINGMSLGILIGAFKNTEYFYLVFFTTIPHAIVELVGFSFVGISVLFLIRYIHVRTTGTKDNLLSLKTLQNSSVKFFIQGYIFITIAGFIEVYL